jgi:SAM-dependent methyltransferase
MTAPRGEVPGLAETFLASRFARGVRPDVTVDAADEMLGFALAARSGDADAALAEYLWNGRWIADAALEVGAARFGSPHGFGRVLDFACGYGRVSRWLAAELGADRLVVSDIVAPAVAFQRRTFGVEGIVSTERPGELAIGERFDLVWVASLFTHLPEPAFHGWLARLTELLTERGLLAFTTLDIALSPEGRATGGRGHRFAPVSESRVLAAETYGTAWTSGEFLERAVAALPGRWQARRFPRAVCDYQDLVLVAPAATEPLARLALDPGPRGFVERAEVRDGRRLTASGWAWDAAARRGVAAVELALAGAPAARCDVLAPRSGDDLAAIAPRDAATDWRLEVDLANLEEPSRLPLWIASRAASGVEKVHFLGRLDELLRAALARERDGWRQRAERAEARAELFSASGFGAAHRAWLRAKRRLGLLPAPLPEELLAPPPPRRK